MTAPLVEDIGRDLEVPLKSFRIMALERAAREGCGPELLTLLEAHLAREDDEECRLLCRHALVLVRARQMQEPPPPLPIEEKFAERFQAAAAPERVQLLMQLPPKERASLAAQAQSWLDTENDPLVAATLIRTFSPHWPAAAIARLSRFLNAPRLSLRTAALEAMVRAAPQLLTRHLPPLLTSPDPRLRILAVQGLAAFDPEAALAHVDQMLQSPDPPTRLTALSNCLLLPFPRAKPLLIRFIASERWGSLLEKAWALLAANADAQLPFHLAAVAEQSTGPRAEMLQRFLGEAIRLVLDAGLTTDAPDVYRRRVDAWRRQVRARRLARDLGSRLHGTPDPDLVVAAVAAQHDLTTPELRQALAEAARDEPDPAVAAILAALAQGVLPTPAQPAPPPAISPASSSNQNAESGASATATSPSQPTAPQPCPPSEGRSPGPSATAAAPRPPSQAALPPRPPTATSRTEAAPASPAASPTATASSQSGLPSPAAPISLIRELALFRPADREWAVPRLRELLNGRHTPPAERAAAFRAAARIEEPEFLPIAREFLTDRHEILALAALEYVGTFAPASLLPLLPQFLHSSSWRLAATALKIAQQEDPARAASALRSLAISRRPSDWETALRAMVYFDFPLVRGILLEMLNRKLPESLFRLGLQLFQANPDPENLYFLIGLETTAPPACVPAVRETRRQVGRLLIELGLLSLSGLGSLEAELTERWRREQTHRRPPSRFTPEALAAAEATRQWWREMLTGWVPALALPALMWLALPWTTPPAWPAGAGPLLPLPTVVSGRLRPTTAPWPGRLLETPAGQRWFIPGPTQAIPASLPASVAEITMTVRPFRRDPDGTILAIEEGSP